MALVLQHQGNDFIRANLAAFFVVSCLLSLLMLATVDRFGMKEVLIALPLMPATLAGYWVAMQTLHLFSHQSLRHISLVLCALSGTVALISYWI